MYMYIQEKKKKLLQTHSLGHVLHIWHRCWRKRGEGLRGEGLGRGRRRRWGSTLCSFWAYFLKTGVRPGIQRVSMDYETHTCKLYSHYQHVYTCMQVYVGSKLWLSEVWLEASHTCTCTFT